MTFQWWKRGEQHELRSHDGRVLWAVVVRRCPFYRIRLYGGPYSRMMRSATLRQAQDIAVEWAEEMMSQ